MLDGKTTAEISAMLHRLIKASAARERYMTKVVLAEQEVKSLHNELLRLIAGSQFEVSVIENETMAAKPLEHDTTPPVPTSRPRQDQS